MNISGIMHAGWVVLYIIYLIEQGNEESSSVLQMTLRKLGGIVAEIFSKVGPLKEELGVKSIGKCKNKTKTKKKG